MVRIQIRRQVDAVNGHWGVWYVITGLCISFEPSWIIILQQHLLSDSAYDLVFTPSLNLKDYTL